MKYRKAKKEDIPGMIDLWKEFIDFHKEKYPLYSRSDDGPENFGKYILMNINSNDSSVNVAESNGEIVAYILAIIQNYPPVFKIKKYGLISDLAVNSRYRRSGIGMNLLQIVKDWFVKKGMSRIEIEVAAANEISTSFWSKMGFKTYKEVRYFDLNTESHA